MCFNQRGAISTLNGSSLKLVDKFTNLGSSVSSTEPDISTWLAKAWIAIDSLSFIWKSDLTDKMKCSVFQAVIVSILLYGCTKWILTKRVEKKLDCIYTKMLPAILNKTSSNTPQNSSPMGNQPRIMKTIKIRRTLNGGHCWRGKDELISDICLWTPSHGWAKAGRPAWINIQ